MSMWSVPVFFKHVVISSQHPMANLTRRHFIRRQCFYPLVLRQLNDCPRHSRFTHSRHGKVSFKQQVKYNDWILMKVALCAAGWSCVSVFLEWHLTGIRFNVFFMAIPSLCTCPHYLNRFYSSQQSALKQEVCTPNNGLLNNFSSFSTSFHTSPRQPHNSALLAPRGKLGACGTRQLSGTHSEREACCFCPADGHLVALPPRSPLLPLALSLTRSGSLAAPPLGRCVA